MRINLKVLVIAAILIISSPLAADHSLGNVYKLKYFDLNKGDDQFIASLSDFNLDELSRSELKEAVTELEHIGDRFAAEGKSGKALIVYEKIKENSSFYWQVYNKIENLHRKNGAGFFSIKNLFSQAFALFSGSKTYLMLTGLAFSSVYFSSLFIFFVFTIVLFFRYFKIFSNDALSNESGNIAIKKIVIFTIILFWPLLYLSGWMIFPFIICGIFWIYLNRYEKRAVTVMVLLILIFSVFFGIRSYLKKNVESESFYTISEVVSGKYFSKADYSKFDNELKVYLAFTYYENKDYNTALDILLSTGEDYKSILKFNILGNIYYRSGNFEESMNYFKNSLDLDEKNRVALENFSIVLALQKNGKIFNSYAARFPDIQQIKNNAHKIKEIKLDSDLLKRRAFYSSEERFSLFSFIGSILKELIQLPVIYYSLLAVLYIFFIGFLFPRLGESTRCSKCNKIIKENAADASNNFCSECYQLFMIKDVIFLEAKVAKEEKIKKKQFTRGILIGCFSLIFPGINLLFREKYYSYIFSLIVFYTFAFFSFAGASLFSIQYSTYPLLFKVTAIFAVIFYLTINIYSVTGDSDGF